MSVYVAQPYISGSPDTEMVGQVVNSFLGNVESEMITPLLTKHGLVNLDPEKWYPYQAWLNVLKDLNTVLGSSNAYVAIGRKAVENVLLPAEINSIPSVLNLLQVIYGMNVRKARQDEGYFIEQKGERHYWMYQNTPNPDYLIYGYIWGLSARFKKSDEHFIVRIIPNPTSLVHPGAIIEVKWGPKDTDLG